MLPDPGLFLLLALLGGWSAVDGTSVGQFMVSRPLVSASLAGLLAGDPVAGAAAGLLVEALHLTVLPVGAARYPESGPPAVVAGGLVALSGAGPVQLLTALVFSLAWGGVGGESIRALRKVNIRLFPQEPGAPIPAGLLERRHLLAIGLDFVRGTALVALGTIVLAAMLALSRLSWGLGERVPQLALAALVAALLAGALRLFGGRTRLFVAGAIGGLLLLLVRG